MAHAADSVRGILKAVEMFPTRRPSVVLATVEVKMVRKDPLTRGSCRKKTSIKIARV